MMRNLADLKAECDRNGIGYGPKPSKEDLEILIRDFYWQRDHAGEEMPPQVEVMLAQKIRDLDDTEQISIWNSPDWTAEEKLDGCRLIMQIAKDGSARFFSRNKSVKDFLYDEKTANLPFHNELKFPELAGTVLDGEILSSIACADTGGTDVNNALTACSAIINAGPDVALNFQKKYGAFKYVIFDIIKFKGVETVHQPFSYRRELRAKAVNVLMEKTRNIFEEVRGTDVNKGEFYKELVKAGGEGVMLKDLRSPYEFGKRRWTLLKAKRFDDYDAFITGFVKSDDEKAWKDYVGALEFSIIDEKTGTEMVIGSVASMPLEFRKWATANPGPECRLNPDLIGKVGIIRGQEFSSKNFRLKHCTLIPGFWEQPVKNGNWLDYFRKDKSAEQCKVDMELIKKTVLQGERI